MSLQTSKHINNVTETRSDFENFGKFSNPKIERIKCFSEDLKPKIKSMGHTMKVLSRKIKQNKLKRKDKHEEERSRTRDSSAAQLFFSKNGSAAELYSCATELFPQTDLRKATGKPENHKQTTTNLTNYQPTV